MNLIDLFGGSLNFPAEDAVTFPIQSLEAPIIATVMNDDWTGGVRAPSVATATPGTEEVGHILNLFVLCWNIMMTKKNQCQSASSLERTSMGKQLTVHVEKSLRCSVWDLLVSLWRPAEMASDHAFCRWKRYTRFAVSVVIAIETAHLTWIKQHCMQTYTHSVSIVLGCDCMGDSINDKISNSFREVFKLVRTYCS